MIKGIIYDLDGTIVSTTKFHEKAWVETGKRFGINISQEFLNNQSGMTNEAATKIIIPDDEQKLRDFVNSKESFVIENAGKFDLFSGVEETFEYLQSKHIDIWICTSAPKEFVEKVYKETPFLSLLEPRTVWREMYKHGKPDAEPILLTLNKMSLANDEAVYVGDAYNDYLSATNAGCDFVYFWGGKSDKDGRIPVDNPNIEVHKDLITLLKL